jgi:Uma2 family endonuclease
MIKPRLTTEEYLELERQSDVRHEFTDGVMHAMAEDKKKNNRVVGRLYRLLAAIAEPKGCDVFFTVVKMPVEGNRVRYPDVVVTCEKDADEYLIQAPCAVFEVLSETTKDVDEGEKLEEYLKIPSVNRYVLLRQDRALAMVYSRQGDSWRFDLLENTGEFDVPCIEARVKIEDIYAGLL